MSEIGESQMSPDRLKLYSSQRRLSQDGRGYSQNSTAHKRVNDTKTEELESMIMLERIHENGVTNGS